MDTNSTIKALNRNLFFSIDTGFKNLKDSSQLNRVINGMVNWENHKLLTIEVYIRNSLLTRH